MDDKSIKELTNHICRATAEAMKVYLFIVFTCGCVIGMFIFSILYWLLKG